MLRVVARTKSDKAFCWIYDRFISIGRPDSSVIEDLFMKSFGFRSTKAADEKYRPSTDSHPREDQCWCGQISNSCCSYPILWVVTTTGDLELTQAVVKMMRPGEKEIKVPRSITISLDLSGTV